MLINVHCHIFDLRTALSPGAADVLRDRLEREVRPPELGRAAARVLVGLVEDAAADELDDETLVRRLLRELGETSGLEDLVREVEGHLPRELRPLFAGGLGALELLAARRLLDRLDAVFARRAGAEEDARRAGVHDVLQFLRIALSADPTSVGRWLVRQMPPEAAAVPLMLEIPDRDGPDAARWRAQLDSTTAAVVALPGRLFPFVYVDPRLDDPRAAVETALGRGFVGVKLYPPMGYDVTDPRLVPVWELCAERDVPILQHATPGGFFRDEADVERANPAHWEGILADHPGLKLCFAHFGGSSNLTKEPIPAPPGETDPDRLWTHRILELMRTDAGRNVYADVSFHLAPTETPDRAERYFGNLERLVDDADLGDRILFGTDFWLIRTRLAEASYWSFFRARLSEARWRRLAEDNPHRFLGLPGAGGVAAPSPPIAGHLDFLADPDRPFGSRPPQPILDLLAATHPAAAERLGALEPPGRVRVPGLRDALSDLVNRRLDDPAVDAIELPAPRVSLGWEAASLTLRGEASLELRVINDEDDEDPEKLVGGEAIPFTSGDAWLRYRLEGRLALEAAGDLAGVGLEGAARGDVGLSDYRRHPGSARLFDVVDDDLSRPRFALSLADVLRLGRGEAVAFERGGELEARLTLPVADVFSFALPALGRSLGIGAAAGVTIDAGVTASGFVRHGSRFRLVFLRDEAGRLRARVEKARVGEGGFSVAAAASFELSDPEAVEAALGRYLGSLLGEPTAEVRALLAKTGRDEADRERLREVAARLGLEGDLDPHRLERELDALLERAFERLGQAVRTKLELGFRYEYSRLEEGSVLFEAVLDDERLGDVHALLVRGELDAVERRAELGLPGLEILELLERERTLLRESFGFSLGVGRWFRFATGDEREIEVFREEDRLGERVRFTYHGARRYEAGSGESLRSWSGDLDAVMPDFSVRPVPTLADFEFGLHLAFAWEGKRLDRELLETVLDLAVLWGVLAPGPMEEVRRRFDELAARAAAGADGGPEAAPLELLGRRGVDVRVDLRFEHPALAAVLPRLVPGDAGSAFAAAMPYTDEMMPQSHVLLRRRAFAPLWRALLAGSLVGDPAREARDHLRPEFPGAAQAEVQFDRPPRWTFAGVVETHPELLSAWNAVRLALVRLTLGVERGPTAAEHTILPTVLRGFHRFWKHSFHVRALGRYLVETAVAEHVEEGRSATVTLTFGSQGQRRTLIVGRGENGSAG